MVTQALDRSSDSTWLFENKIAHDECLIDAKSLAERLGFSVWTIRKWRAEERIPYVRLGRAIRYNPKKVVGYLQSQRR